MPNNLWDCTIIFNSDHKVSTSIFRAHGILVKVILLFVALKYRWSIIFSIIIFVKVGRFIRKILGEKRIILRYEWLKYVGKFKIGNESINLQRKYC